MNRIQPRLIGARIPPDRTPRRSDIAYVLNRCIFNSIAQAHTPVQERMLKPEPMPNFMHGRLPLIFTREIGAPSCDVADNHGIADHVGIPCDPRHREVREPFDFVELDSEIVAKIDVSFCVVDTVGIEESIDYINVDVSVIATMQSILHVGFGLREDRVVRPCRVDSVVDACERHLDTVREVCVVDYVELLLQQVLLFTCQLVC